MQIDHGSIPGSAARQRLDGGPAGRLPQVASRETLHLRIGLRWDADIPPGSIVAVERAPSGKGLRMGVVEPRTAAMSDAAMHLGARSPGRSISSHFNQ